MPDSPLNFYRAEYGGDAVALSQCPWCGRGLEKLFYRANDTMICQVCAAKAISITPIDTAKVFWKSVAWGSAAAIGLSLAMSLGNWILLRWVQEFLAGFFIALASLGTGYAIGKTMRLVAKGAGGRRYQIAASVLTYSAVTIALSLSFTHFSELPPLWALPFFTLAPLVWLFTGRSQEASLILTMAFIGIRWAWIMLKPWPLKITGPEFLPNANSTASGEQAPEA